jgi:hypothetical protein
MTTGLQGSGTDPRYATVLLIENGGTSAPVEAAPATALAAIPVATKFYAISGLLTQHGLRKLPAGCVVRVCNTAGTGAVSITYVRLWEYHSASAKMYPLGIGADADKGKLNNGAALGVTGTDVLRHAETVPIAIRGDGIQAEIGVTAGTGTETFNVYLDVPLFEAA